MRLSHKMATNLCSFHDCQTNSEIPVKNVFFPFPIDFDLCFRWVQNMGQLDLMQEFLFAGALPFTNKYICPLHFNRDDFIDPDDHSLGLKPNACPILNNSLIKTEDFYEDINIKEEPFDEDPQTLQKNKESAEKAKIRRLNETPEQKSERQRKDRIRAMERRKKETDEEKRERKRIEALRTAIRRQNETDEQKKERNAKETVQAAKRRSMESPEQREKRLKKDRERAAMRRFQEKIFGKSLKREAESIFLNN